VVQLTRIYTKGGDKGKTSLGSGERVSKHHVRMHAIGDVDEVNCTIGVAIHGIDPVYHSLLIRIQNDLFDVGADLCLPDMSLSNVLRIQKDQVLYLENKIDEINCCLNPLTSFVLPGGALGSAQFHWLRSVVRRAERSVCDLHDQEPLNGHVIQYINRLSDLFFVLARASNDMGKNDVLWVPGANRL